MTTDKYQIKPETTLGASEAQLQRKISYPFQGKFRGLRFGFGVFAFDLSSATCY